MRNKTHDFKAIVNREAVPRFLNKFVYNHVRQFLRHDQNTKKLSTPNLILQMVVQ